MNPEVKCRIHKGSPIIPILTQMNTVPASSINTSSLNIYSNIVMYLCLVDLEGMELSHISRILGENICN